MGMRRGVFDPDGLRTAWERAGLTRHELASLVGVAGGERVSRWERGASVPRPETIAVLCEVLAVNSTQLLVGVSDARALRLERGLTVDEMAERTGVGRSKIACRERGVARLKPAQVQSVAAVLGAPTGSLIVAQNVGERV